ncbi:MAG: divergent polysaccharide deacetylase family protein [Lutimaribacter sp.]
MVRGFFGGLVVGSVLSVAGLGAASVWVGPRGAPLANAPVPEAQVQSPSNPAPDSAAAKAPAADTADPAADAAAPADMPAATTEGTAAPAQQPSPDAAPQMAGDSALPPPADTPAPAAAPAPAPVATQPSVAQQPMAPAPAAAQRPSVAQSGPMIEAPAAPRLMQELPTQAVIDTNTPARPEASTELAPPDQPTAPMGEEASTDAALPAPVAQVPAPTAAAPVMVAAAPPAMSSRLPSVGQTPPPPAALDLYASNFENPEAKPLMSIVLIDRGDFTGAVDALANFPYQVSFALDPARPGAAEAMARYRAAGFEVLALADIPETATAGDVEASLGAALAALPETVAVLEGDKAGLQGSREISDQVAAILGETGHGLILAPRGLDTARKSATKAGLAAATLFRDFDAKGQDANAVRRFLDQAAFKAGQDGGGIIMVGRTRPETISALILWGLADRAERVALAPVSAVLKEAAQAR